MKGPCIHCGDTCSPDPNGVLLAEGLVTGAEVCPESGETPPVHKFGLPCFICGNPTDEEFDSPERPNWCETCYDNCPPPPKTGKKHRIGGLGIEVDTFKSLPYYMMTKEQLKEIGFQKHWLDPEFQKKTEEAKQKAKEVKKEHRQQRKEANMDRMLNDLRDSPWVT